MLPFDVKSVAFLPYYFFNPKLKFRLICLLQFPKCLLRRDQYRSSHLDVFLRKGILKICSRFEICRTPMPKCDFNKVAKLTHFRMGVLLYICCMFSEHLLFFLILLYLWTAASVSNYMCRWNSIFKFFNHKKFFSRLTWNVAFQNIQKVRSLKILEFCPPPLFALFVFEHHTPPPPKVRSFFLELHLSPSISILVKFREKKLMSISIFGWTQRKKNQKSSKVNIKFTICHDIPSPDLLEGPKDRKIKENAKFFSFIH